MISSRNSVSSTKQSIIISARKRDKVQKKKEEKEEKKQIQQELDLKMALKKDPFSHNENLKGVDKLIEKLYWRNDEKGRAKRDFQRKLKKDERRRKRDERKST